MSWDTRITEFINIISKDTSECAELIADLITRYFPENESDIFTQLPERSQNVFKRDEVEKELGQDITKEIKQNLIEYRDASSKRSEYMTNLVKRCDIFYNNLITGKNKNNINLIPIAITYSIMHLAILKERSTYHKEIYKTNKSDETYDSDLKRKVQDIETDQAAIARYTEMCNRSNSRLFNEAKAEFMKMYMNTFALDKFLPNNSNAPTIAPNREIGTLIFGIYGNDTFPDGDHGPDDHGKLNPLGDVKRDVITGFNVHAGFYLDCLTVKFKNQDAFSAGNEKGGEATTIRGLNAKHNYVIGVDVYFRDEVVSAIRFYMSDGQITEVLGNGEKIQKKTDQVNCGLYHTDFKLVGVQMAEANSDKYAHNRCVGHISFIFEHMRIAD
ncbi:10352_t:CDS:2 [Dentiscutata erythropus]|uniref:10352_t:CDS:1 n=1 Tax=Dentiscutata erythropus TaxID=1348616 RepID=A0A9N9E7R0_9GLOM|nr:10352_t:CDS:2 [Dentiscutata erythropus]